MGGSISKDAHCHKNIEIFEKIYKVSSSKRFRLNNKMLFNQNDFCGKVPPSF